MYALDIFLSGSPLFFVLNRFIPTQDEKALPIETRNKIENKIRELATKADTRQEIELREDSMVPAFAQSFDMGDMLFLGRPTIIINPKVFENMDDESLEKNLADRISNLKSNDNLKAPIFGCIVGLITFAVLSILFPHLAIGLPYIMASPAGMSGAFAAYSAVWLYYSWRELGVRDSARLLLKA